MPKTAIPAAPALPKYWPIFVYVLAFVSVVAVLAVLLSYGMYAGYLDHGESIVAAAAFKMLDGAEIYPAFDGPNFTSNVYGPILFAVNGLMLALFGGNVVAAKLCGLLAVLASIISIGSAFRRDGAIWVVFAVMALSGFLLLNIPYSIWNRPDPLLVLISALTVLVVRSTVASDRPLVSALLIGVLAGLASGLKIYGLLFVAPLGLYLAMSAGSLRAGISMVCVMTVAGLATLAVPFLHPVFSAENYLSWFGMVAAKPTSGGLVTKALRYGVFTLLPPMLLVAQRLWAGRGFAAQFRNPTFAYAATTLIGVAGCVYLGSKPGAGMYYILPFAPLAIDMMVRCCKAALQQNQGLSVRAALSIFTILALVMLVASVPVQKRFYRALHWDLARAINADLREIDSRFMGQKIQMGVGNSIPGYHKTVQKTELVFRGHPYTVDFGIMMETSKIGIPLPDALIQDLEDCTTNIWLIPIGETPFDIVGYYGNKVVDERFRAIFLQNYAPFGQSRFFEIWKCRNAD